jgi:hypothetical protein
MKKQESVPSKDTIGKDKVIHLTDIKFHTTPKRPTPSLGKKIRKCFQDNTPGRIYNSLTESLALENYKSFILEMLQRDQDLMKMVQEENAKGCKVFIEIPKEGIPVLLGEDTIKFLKGKNGRRISRKRDKIDKKNT